MNPIGSKNRSILHKRLDSNIVNAAPFGYDYGITSKRRRSRPKCQAQVAMGTMSGGMEDFQVKGGMCLMAALARYNEVGKYFKYRCDSRLARVADRCIQCSGLGR